MRVVSGCYWRSVTSYVTVELTDGERLPLMRLRYGGSAHRWGTASTNDYENQVWFTGTTEEAFDLVCDLKLGPRTP